MMQRYQREDIDGGVISVPNTGVWTVLIALVPNNRFALEEVEVTVLDAAALNNIRWRLTVNGIPVYGFSDQRTLSFQSNFRPVRVAYQTFPLVRLALEAINSAGPGAFDAIGHFMGDYTR